MATSGKNRRTGRGHRHLIDVSDPADPRADEDGWLAGAAASTVTERPLATSGKVEVWIEPEEYEEYSRLKQNGVDSVASAPAEDPSTVPDETGETAAGDRGEGVAAFLAQINTAPAAPADPVDAVEGEDEFLAQFTRPPERPRYQPAERSGSAALDGVAAAPDLSHRPLGSRRRVWAGGWRRWASLAAAVVLLAGVASVLLQSHTATRARDPASATSPDHPDPFAHVSAVLSAVNGEVRGVAQNAVSQGRAAVEVRHEATATLSRVTAHERANRRRRVTAAASAARTRARHRTPAVSQTTPRPAPPATTARSVSAPAQTVTVAPPTTKPPTSATTPKQSTSATTSAATTTTTAPTSTPTHAYGQGGVLGAGHSSGSS